MHTILCLKKTIATTSSAVKSIMHCSTKFVSIFCSYPCKKATGILAGSWRDPTGIPAGSCQDFGRRDFRSPLSIPAGSWRDYHRDPAEILAAEISLRAESTGGIARRNFGRRVFAPRRESRQDLGGITTGIPLRFWPPGFRFAPRALAGLPAEIVAATFLLPAVNPGGILAGLPPGSRRDFGRWDFASRQESQRELGENSCQDFGCRGSASCRESRRDLGGLTHQEFGRRDSRFSLRILQRSRRDSPLGKIDLYGF